MHKCLETLTYDALFAEDNKCVNNMLDHSYKYISFLKAYIKAQIIFSATV